MKWFYDPTQDAVGTCKSCGKGLSQEHLSDLDKGLACKGRCEGDVRLLIGLIERNISSMTTTNQLLKRGSGTAYGGGVFLTLMGVIFLVTGSRDPHFDLLFYMGVGFLAYGVWTLVRTYRYAAIVSKLR